jgi:hypothetical protein
MASVVDAISSPRSLRSLREIRISAPQREIRASLERTVQEYARSRHTTTSMEKNDE